MADVDQYQVVAECVYGTVSGPLGTAVQLLMKGAPFPAGDAKLQVYLDAGYVAKTSGDVGGVDADGIPAGAYDTDVPAGVTSTPVEKTAERRKADADAAEKAKADVDLAQRRAEAKSKLPANKAMPDGRASQAVWVEYLVACGYNDDDVKGADKDELIKLAKQQS